jgi:hypothetical protein
MDYGYIDRIEDIHWFDHSMPVISFESYTLQGLLAMLFLSWQVDFEIPV